MAHPRTAILTAFREALDALPTQPTLLESAARPVPADKLPALAIVPGEEAVMDAAHSTTGIDTVRRLRVRCVCSAKTREAADQLALEVEDAAPYQTAGLGASYVGSDFAEDGDGEAIVFAVRVNFDVLYEAVNPAP